MYETEEQVGLLLCAQVCLRAFALALAGRASCPGSVAAARAMRCGRVPPGVPHAPRTLGRFLGGSRPQGAHGCLSICQRLGCAHRQRAPSHVRCHADGVASKQRNSEQDGVAATHTARRRAVVGRRRVLSCPPPRTASGRGLCVIAGRSVGVRPSWGVLLHAIHMPARTCRLRVCMLEAAGGGGCVFAQPEQVLPM